MPTLDYLLSLVTLRGCNYWGSWVEVLARFAKSAPTRVISFIKSFRLISTTQSLHLMPLPKSGKSFRIPIEGINNGGSSFSAFVSAQPPLFPSHLKRYFLFEAHGHQ